MSMYFVLECKIGFFAIPIAPCMSSMITVGLSGIASSFLSQTTSWVTALTDIYSASDVDRAAIACFLLSQLTGPLTIKKRLPVVECLSSESPAQSASAYPINVPFSDF